MARSLHINGAIHARRSHRAAGGLNLYGFAGGDPINFSDPFGLCPYEGEKRTATLRDCTEDDRKKAFGHLVADRGSEGQETVQTFIDNELTFELTDGSISCEGVATTSCTTGTTVQVDGTQASQVVAADLVREGTHVMMRGKGMTRGREEILSWDRALNFYGRLPRSLRTGAEYNAAGPMRKNNRAAFEAYFCSRLKC